MNRDEPLDFSVKPSDIKMAVQTSGWWRAQYELWEREYAKYGTPEIDLVLESVWKGWGKAKAIEQSIKQPGVFMFSPEYLGHK